ncbi:MAG: hypothetical protein M5U15_12080 [Kiritimatiellae bacterium]|nr:hypothetical protein [Kiritimatiellia bacterium]
MPKTDPPFLCLITPVFDPALESLTKLVAAVKKQTLGDFIHVMVSNGPSPAIKGFIANIARDDPRFIYDEIEEEPTGDSIAILLNLGKRRNYAMKNYEAVRYLFLDSDLKILDNDYFRKLHLAHAEIKRDVFVTQVQYAGRSKMVTLPIFPIQHSRLDIANYCFTRAIAETYNYPTDYIGVFNDYRFFSMIATEHNTAILDFVSAERDGNASHTRLSESYREERKEPPPPRAGALTILTRHIHAAFLEIRNREK